MLKGLQADVHDHWALRHWGSPLWPFLPHDCRTTAPDWKLLWPARLDLETRTILLFCFFFSNDCNQPLCVLIYYFHFCCHLLLPVFMFYLWLPKILQDKIYSMFHAIAERKAKYPFSVPQCKRLVKKKEKKQKPKGLLDGQLHVFACDQNSRGEAEMETNTRPNQSNVVFGPTKREKRECSMRKWWL